MAGLAIGSLGLGVNLVAGAPAQAACVGAANTQTNCPSFNPTTSTSITLFGYGDAGFYNSTGISSIIFQADNTPPVADWSFSPSPVTISNIQYSLDGGSTFITTNILTSTTLSSLGTSANIVTGPINGLGTGGIIGNEQFQLKFDIAGGLTSSNAGPLGTVVSGTGNGTQIQSRFNDVIPVTPPTTDVPGPLAVLGAGTAFGFSRKLRRRVNSVAA